MNIEDLPPKYQEQARMKLNDFEVDTSSPGRPTLVRKSKYHAEKTEVDGIMFDSRKEADFYARLKLLEKAGEISDLKLQPRFELQEPFICDGKKERKIEYVADFSFIQGGKRVVIDVKGVRTQVYKLKRKLFLYKYGDQVEFREV